jgi:hypothetical protein
MSEGLKDMRNMTSELSRGQKAIESSLIKLTENLHEMQRMDQRIDMRLESIITNQKAKDDEQDKEIRDQRAYINKALGVLGTLTFLVPTIISVVSYLNK